MATQAFNAEHLVGLRGKLKVVILVWCRNMCNIVHISVCG